MVSRISRERPDIVQSIGNVYFQRDTLRGVCSDAYMKLGENHGASVPLWAGAFCIL